MTTIWWCNQTRCWVDEREAGVVCAALAQSKSGDKFRETVGRARKGDIVVHYISSPIKGIVAISRAKTDGVRKVISLADYGVKQNDCWYGEEPGWLFETEYHDFNHPILRNQISRQVIALNLEESPILSNGNVRFAYFVPFDMAGLRIIRQVSQEPWPMWAESVL